MRTPPLTPKDEEPHGNRVDEIVEAISLLKPFIEKIEEGDPQYVAIKRLVKKLGPRALSLVIGNALVSYRLSGTGERYWTEFSEYFLENPDATLEDFLQVSKYNKALKRQKLERIRKVRPLLNEIEREPSKFRDLDYLRERLKAVLKAKGTEKTLVFALKMAYYAFKALGEEVSGDVPLPMDLRISAITYASGLLNAHPDEIMNKYRDAALKRWEEVARRAGVKTLHLDALLWLPSNGLREALKKGLIVSKKLFANNLKELGIPEDIAEKVSEKLVVRDLAPS